MALTSSSTIQDALNQYNDNLAWDGNATKAALALEAVRYILINRPKVIATNNRNINFDSLREEKTRLEEFIRHTDSSNRCRFTRGRMIV